MKNIPFRLFLWALLLFGIAVFISSTWSNPKVVSNNTCTSCQGRYWYIGSFFAPRYGLDFTNGAPELIPLTEQFTSESTSVITDENGEVLFSTNGKSVWNKNNELLLSLDALQFNTPLSGNRSATHTLVLPQPGNDSLYYIFHPNAIEDVEEDSLAEMRYSIINMNLDGGLGEVEEKNVFLFAESTEKVAGIRHCNGVDWWVVTHERGSNIYRTWLLDENGVSENSIDSEVGLGNTGIFASNAGTMKISPNGRYMIVVTVDDEGNTTSDNMGHIELHKFNQTTGIIEEFLVLEDFLRSCYGASFSPDNSKLYCYIRESSVISLEPPIIMQYDLSSNDSATILATKYTINFDSSELKGQLEIGLDGKIYVTQNPFSIYDNLDIIHNPNEYGAACNYEERGFDVSDGNMSTGLPTFPASYFAPAKPWLIAPSTLCLKDSIAQIYVTGNCATQEYDWEILGEGIVNQAIGDTAWVQFITTGMKEVAVHRTTACGIRSDTVEIEVKNSLFSRDTIHLCAGDSVLVFGEWVSQSGNFSELYIDEENCDSLAEVVVNLSPEIAIDFVVQSPCAGEENGVIEALVNGGNPNYNYQWSNGIIQSTNNDIGAGNYQLTVTDNNGCQQVSEVFLEAELTPQVNILEVAQISCADAEDGQITLEVVGEVNDYEITWSDDNQQSGLTAENLAEGSYNVTISNQSGCETILSNIEITNPSPLLLTGIEDQTILLNEEIMLFPEISGGQPPYEISWATTPEVTLSCLDCLTPTLTGSQSTTLELTVLDTNECFINQIIEITVISSSNTEGIFTPNIFSPNGDMINDYFNLYSSEEGITNISIQIFDRWGGMVYENQHYKIGVSQGWDGKLNGEYLNPNVYVYLIGVERITGNEEVIKGSVVLVR